MEPPTSERLPRDSRALGPGTGCLGLYVSVFAFLAAVYGLTAQRSPAWHDSGIYQLRILHFDLTGQGGLALAHPLLILLGKALSFLPVGGLAWRMNFLSGLCAAVAAANVATLVRRLAPEPRRAAWVAAGFFGLAYTTWWLGTICESQCLLAALFTTELHVLVWLVRRPGAAKVFLLAVLSGLGAATHDLALLAVPAYVGVPVALCLRRRLGWGSLGLLAGGWALGAAPILVLVFQAAGEVGLGAAVHSALFGHDWQGQVLGFSAPAAGAALAYVAYNFPNLALPLAGVGAWSLRNRVGAELAWAAAYLAAVYLAFAVRYAVPDQFMFFLPFYALVAVGAGLGLARLCPQGRRGWLAAAATISLFVAPGLYAAAPTVWRQLAWGVPGRGDLPFRDPYTYWLTPWKTLEDSADQFAREALREAPAHSVIVADGTSYPPLVWRQDVDAQSRDVRVLRSSRATPQSLPPGTPDAFVVSDVRGCYPDWLGAKARLRRAEGRLLYRVAWDSPATHLAPHLRIDVREKGTSNPAGTEK